MVVGNWWSASAVSRTEKWRQWHQRGQTRLLLPPPTAGQPLLPWRPAVYPSPLQCRHRRGRGWTRCFQRWLGSFLPAVARGSGGWPPGPHRRRRRRVGRHFRRGGAATCRWPPVGGGTPTRRGVAAAAAAPRLPPGTLGLPQRRWCGAMRWGGEGGRGRVRPHRRSGGLANVARLGSICASRGCARTWRGRAGGRRSPSTPPPCGRRVAASTAASSRWPLSVAAAVGDLSAGRHRGGRGGHAMVPRRVHRPLEERATRRGGGGRSGTDL